MKNIQNFCWRYYWWKTWHCFFRWNKHNRSQPISNLYENQASEMASFRSYSSHRGGFARVGTNEVVFFVSEDCIQLLKRCLFLFHRLPKTEMPPTLKAKAPSSDSIISFKMVKLVSVMFHMCMCMCVLCPGCMGHGRWAGWVCAH